MKGLKAWENTLTQASQTHTHQHRDAHTHRLTLTHTALYTGVHIWYNGINISALTHAHTQAHKHTHTHTSRNSVTHSRASVLSFLSLDYIKIASAIRICGTKFTFHFALISCHTLFFSSSLAFAFPFDILFCVLWVFKVQSIFNTSHGADTHTHTDTGSSAHTLMHTHADEAHIRS